MLVLKVVVSMLIGL
ncbi:hypothetical protein MTR67_005495 [Solanum verrucosum]|uniref:Uncharacterized protein n=1 Tax=Solanum verrucosum TaxID=315347 RepID=A0AAF0PYB1_SOLVR|nr:hypothetical protein MTR67_005495 [Solanum verrucosum]